MTRNKKNNALFYLKSMFYVFPLVVICSFDTPVLVKKKLTENVSMLVPKDFIPISDDDLARRYVSFRKPVAMLTSADGQAEIGLNNAYNKFPDSNLSILKDFYKSSLMSMYSNVVFSQDTIKRINDRDYFVFEFVSEVKGDQNSVYSKNSLKKYTYIQYTLFNDILVILNFTAPPNWKKDWHESVNTMMESVVITNKKPKTK